MRVAVVGAGISGLVAAYLLSDVHEVTVFEANAYAGGHTHTVRVDGPEGTHDIDTGFIVFNDKNYPLFTRLLRALDVESQRTSMSFSVSDPDGMFEFSSGSVNGLFAVRRHLWDRRYHLLLRDVVRCQRAAGRMATDPRVPCSLGEWVEAEGFSEPFVHQVLVPMVASIWSADPKQMWSVPAPFLARFFDHHGMLGLRNRPRWYTIAGGSDRYVAQLLRRLLGRVRLSTPVSEVRRHEDGVTVTPVGGPGESFDRVVLATHSDQALRLLVDATDREADALAGIPYQENDVVLHTDARILPRRRRAWASWNYHLVDPPPDRVVMTYDMTRLQRLATRTRYCVTLNRSHDIDPSRVLGRFTYAHPVYGPGALRTQSSRAAISGHNRTHFCGAYWGWGFHEDGVRSGVRVAEELGGRWLSAAGRNEGAT